MIILPTWNSIISFLIVYLFLIKSIKVYLIRINLTNQYCQDSYIHRPSASWDLRRLADETNTNNFTHNARNWFIFCDMLEKKVEQKHELVLSVSSVQFFLWFLPFYRRVFWIIVNNFATICDHFSLLRHNSPIFPQLACPTGLPRSPRNLVPLWAQLSG